MTAALFTDSVAIDAPRRTADGYLVATVKAARTGIQNYLGREVGRPDLATVRVYRPEEEVFSADTIRSFAHRPVTIDHPPEAVGATNWRQHSVGMTGDEIARDEGFVRVQMVIMDHAAITAVEGGKRELSMGYNCQLDWTPGTTPEGEAYDARQTRIRGNHLAIVTAGRAGPHCRIGDSWPKDPKALVDFTYDGETVQVPEDIIGILNQKVAEISEIRAKRKAVQDHLDEQLADRDRQIAELNDQLSDAGIERRVQARYELTRDARRLLPQIIIDGQPDEEIRRTVVSAKIGDRANTLSDAEITGAFVGMLAASPEPDPVRDALMAKPMAPAIGTKDMRDAAYEQMLERQRTAWKQ